MLYASRQTMPPSFRNTRWWLVSIPLVTLLLASLGIFIRLTQTSAATNSPGDQITLVQLSHDPYAQVSPALHETGYEPAAASFGSTMVSVFQLGRFTGAQGNGATNLGWTTSTDNGHHWHTGVFSGTTKYAGGSYDAISNASVAYDPAHHTWLAVFLLIDHTTVDGFVGPSQVDIGVSRSQDGGLTWSKPVMASVAPSGNVSYDKPWMSCDTSVRSPFYGHCYILWNASPAIDLSTSTDGGRTWGAVKHSAQPFSGVSGELVVQPDGTVVVLTPDDGVIGPNPRQQEMVAFTSTDGGQSWGAPVPVAPYADFPGLTVDAHGTLYGAWIVADTNGSAIVLTHSTDGIHWTVPQTIIGPEGSAIFYNDVALAADPRAEGPWGHLALTYYVSDGSSVSSSTMQAFLLTSTNGGRQWSSAQPLSGPMSVNWLVPSRTVGDYTSLVFNHGSVFPFFVIGTPRGSNDPYYQNVYTVKDGIYCSSEK